MAVVFLARLTMNILKFDGELLHLALEPYLWINQ